MTTADGRLTSPSTQLASVLVALQYAAALGAAALAMHQAATIAGGPVDFRYFWLSGRIWLEGGDPYGPALGALGAEIFPMQRINPFFYPPNWRLIAELTASAPLETAARTWAAMSVVATAGAAACLSRLFTRRTAGLAAGRGSVVRFAPLGFIVAMFASQGLQLSMAVGQPTPFLLLAVAGLLVAANEKRRGLAAACLVVLLLKPQFGLPLLMVAASAPGFRKAAMIAAAATAGLCLFGLMNGAPLTVAGSFLTNLSAYGGFPENAPLAVSGPQLFLAWAGAPTPPGIAQAATSIVAAALAGMAAGYAADAKAIAGAHAVASSTHAFVAALVVALWMSPTHNVDFVLALPVMALPFLTIDIARDRLSRALTLVGAIILMRSMSIVIAIGGDGDPQVSLAAIDFVGSSVLFAAVLAWGIGAYQAPRRAAAN